MLTRGRKPLPDSLKLVRSTLRPSRVRRPRVPALEGSPRPPAWLTGAARRLFATKVETYRRRGQSVVGCEGSLAIYCQLEARIGAAWRRGDDVQAAYLNALR